MKTPFIESVITKMVKGKRCRIVTTSGTLRGKLRSIEETKYIHITIRGKTFSVLKDSIKVVTVSKKVRSEQ